MDSPIGQTPAEAALSPGMPRGNQTLALTLMVTAQFMVILDSAIVNVALPTIQRSLGFSPVGIEGVITAYATAFGSVLILGGRFCDSLGRRRIFVIGMAAFGLTSLACALATSPSFLVVARVAQGLSAGFLAPAALALLTTTFTEGAQRNRALGIFGVATSLGFVAGQVLGGVLATSIGWQSIFVINVPVAAVALFLVRRAIKPDAGQTTRRRPDLLGAALITASMAVMVWSPTQGAQHGWGSAQFLFALVGSFVLLGIFGVVEAKRRNPLVRLSMLRSRWLAGANFMTAVTGALNGAVVLLCTLFLQQAHGYTSLEAGLCFIPTGLAGFVAGARIAGPLITRLGVRNVLAGGAVISAVMVGGISFLPGNGNYLPLLGWLIGIGAIFTTTAVGTTVAASSGVAPHEQGMAAGLRQTSFQLGVALGVAVFLSVAASHTSAILAHHPHPSQVAALAAGYRVSLKALSVLSLLGALAAYTTLRQKSDAPPAVRAPARAQAAEAAGAAD